ncbi:MAG: choice-of-anchor D domain-containing protein [Archangium sp.]|nr:choice-of-anchor D domain-containing protein [Archangium sp.]
MNRLLSFAVLALAVTSCKENKVQPIAPTLATDVLTLDFGPVRVGTTANKTIEVSAVNGADIQLTSITLEGDGAFTLETPPTSLRGLGKENLQLHFSPVAAGDVSTTLIIRSDDELKPEVRIEIAGRGAFPRLELVVGCETSASCEATVSSTPPRITFAPEPFVRLRAIDPSTLPVLRLRSTGEVPAVVTGLSLGGTDRSAFSFVGNAALPDGGLVLAPMQEASVPVQFRPTSDAQQAYVGEVKLATDDPAASLTVIPLSGNLRPNFPPRVCANVARVSPVGAQPRDYDTASAWAEVMNVDGGVNLSATRDVPPRAEVVLSALSEPSETFCTTDPEDGRLGLTWSWRLISTPSGSTAPVLNNATTPRATLRPAATGLYTAELSVTDSQNNAGVTTVTFEVAVKNDLVVQLDWTGSNGVDVDLHLVRPGASPFSPFTQPDGGLTSGDLNGYSATSRPDGGAFDWGFAGVFDDPRLNFDDTGGGSLLENISLNGPEGDEACASGPCTYGVFVHGFRDARTDAGVVSCVVDGGAGCLDGESCGCANGTVCVALNAPLGAAALGAGRCLAPVAPVVRVFLRGSATAAVSVPLMLGAPCQMIHAADVVWPMRGSDAGVQVTAASGVTRYGVRGGGLQCAPDGLQSGVPWYSAQPR